MSTFQIMRHLSPEIWKAGVVISSLPLKLFTEAQPASLADVSIAGDSMAGGVSAAVGGCEPGWVAGADGIV